MYWQMRCFFHIPLLFEPSNPKRRQWKCASNGTHIQVHEQTEGSRKGKCRSTTNFFLFLIRLTQPCQLWKLGARSRCCCLHVGCCNAETTQVASLSLRSLIHGDNQLECYHINPFHFNCNNNVPFNWVAAWAGLFHRSSSSTQGHSL